MAGFNFNHTPKDVPLINTKYRKITTQIPNTESVAMLEKAYQIGVAINAWSDACGLGPR